MERKTKISAEDGKQDLLITREFDLPVELLFTAHVEPGIFEEWMSHEYGRTKVIKLDCRKHGSWQFETSDPSGNVALQANGVFHDVVPDEKIIRTFEMANTAFPVQLEFITFEKLGDDRSKLSIHIVYKSLEHRNQMLKMPFAQGMNMAHDRLQAIVGKLKQ